MAKQIIFKYSPHWRENAVISKVDCNCPNDLPCLEDIFFEDPDVEGPVCLDDLIAGRTKVFIPEYLRSDLLLSIKLQSPNLSGDECGALVDKAVELLSRTPPVAWIQNNQWTTCCGDFCGYIGEWGQEKLNKKSKDGNGRAFLWDILSEVCKKRRSNSVNLWDEIDSGKSIVYVFECLYCSRVIAVDQSY